MLLFQTVEGTQLNESDQVEVKVVTDENDGRYITTVNQFSVAKFKREVQLYLWYFSHNRNLAGFRDSIQEYLENHGHDQDKENRVSPDYYKNDAEFFAERIDERMGDVLELEYASDFADTLYGHTVVDIQVKLLSNTTNEETVCVSKEYDEATEQRVLKELTGYIAR